MNSEQNSTLPFLDTLIRKTNDGRLLTSVYRKPTFTGLGLNFFSNTPEIFKINSIKTILHRAYTISSNFNFLHDEICHLKTYFLNNKYPMQIIENVINTFLSKKCNPPVKSPIIVPKLKKYIKLPFYGPESYKMRNSLILCCNMFLNAYYTQIYYLLAILFIQKFAIGPYNNKWLKKMSVIKHQLMIHAVSL